MQPTPKLKSVACLLLLGWLLLPTLTHAQNKQPITVKAINIRSLTPDQATQHPQLVRLQGTVIFVDNDNAVFLQDETAGTLFWRNRDNPTPPPKPGDLVEVQGITRYGLYLPGIGEKHYRVLSHGPMPEPIDATYEDLLSGRYHYQWVRIEGIVRSHQEQPENTTPTPSSSSSNSSNTNTRRHTLRVALGSNIVEVRLNHPPNNPKNLIDSRVRITGLASGSINDRRQLVQPYLWPHDDTCIHIIDPPPDTTQLPLTPIEQLLTFTPSGRSNGHRVRITGTVLAAFPDGRIFLRDSSHALSLTLLHPNPNILPGESIEVLGFPEMERFSASLADATISKRNSGPPPSPATPTMPDLLRGSHDNDLITLTASVAETYQTETGPLLLLQANRRTLRAPLPPKTHIPIIGSRIQITGICQVESSKPIAYLSTPQTLSLHPRNPNDLIILDTPSWWTSQRLFIALILLAIATSLALLWIILLRRQVDNQTNTLRNHIQHQAILEERQRIAREFHDTLEQDLTGLSLQLGAAASVPPSRTTNLLQTARNLVTRIQTETRNLLSDLRTPPDQTLPLPTLLQNLVDSRSNSSTPTITLNIPTPIPPLPPHTLHHLRMITQESLANALRHANASSIHINLSHNNQLLTLSISDNGQGFDPSETWEKTGHYGCMGIRERARKINAQVLWHSQPNQGTSVEIQLKTPNHPH